MPENGKNIDALFNLRASFPEESERKAFFDAARENDIRGLEAILEKWPEAAEKWADGGKPVLLSIYNTATLPTVEFLVSKGARLEQTEADGNWTPLILASFVGTAKNVEAFLRAGAQVDARDKAGRTALGMAVDKGKLEIVDMLVLCGADPNVNGKGYGHTTIMQDCKTDELRDVITNAMVRRAAFLSGQKVTAPGPAAPETALADDSDEIKLLKRIELRKAGEEPASKSAPAVKKQWWKLGF